MGNQIKDLIDKLETTIELLKMWDNDDRKPLYLEDLITRGRRIYKRC